MFKKTITHIYKVINIIHVTLERVQNAYENFDPCQKKYREEENLLLKSNHLESSAIVIEWNPNLIVLCPWDQISYLEMHGLKPIDMCT